MVFGIPVGKDGQILCMCCKYTLWHCKKCWSKWHNSHNAKDYIEPSYYGQSLIPDELYEKMRIEDGIIFASIINVDKNRHYKEGEYH